MKLRKFTFYILSIVLFAACKKADGPDAKLYIQAPQQLELSVEKTSVIANWDYQGNQQIGFVAQVASDVNFVNILKTDTIGLNEREITFEDMGYFTELFVRVRALSSDIVINSDYAIQNVKPESVLKDILKPELTATSAILRWDNPIEGTLSNVLLIDNKTNTERNIQLSATNVSEQSLLIDGLESAGNYTVVIFSGEERKGVLSFSSVDLRMSIFITGSTTIYETLHDAVEKAVNNDVINVGGATYDFSALPAIDINKSLTIKVVEDSEVAPTIMMSNFNFTGEAALKLSGINFIINATTSQIFVGTPLSGTASIEIEDCEISGARNGLVYIANSNTTGTLGITAKNSIFKNTGSDGGDYIDFRGGKIKNMLFENCTFHNVGRTFVRFDSPVTKENPDQPVTFTNCTINQIGERIGSNGGQLVNIRTSIAILFTKSIVTNKKNGQNNGIAGGGKGSFVDNVIFGTNSASINGGGFVSTNVQTLDPQYKNESIGDLTVENPVVKALGYGDQRWLK